MNNENIRIVRTTDKKDWITNISGVVGNDNSIELTWDWPKNTYYDKCAIFEIQEDEKLETLLEGKKPVIVADTFDMKYASRIVGYYNQFKLYPVHMDKAGELEIVNQIQKNVTNKFLRKVTLEYMVRYEKPFLAIFRKYKKAILTLRGINELNQTFLYYRCSSKDGMSYRYGIDIKRFPGGQYEFYLKKNAFVYLELTEEQKEFIKYVRR